MSLRTRRGRRGHNKPKRSRGTDETNAVVDRMAPATGDHALQFPNHDRSSKASAIETAHRA
jgi:hypothetical protein